VSAALTNRERRVLANLAIPRGPAELEHQLRIDPHSPSLSAQEALEEVKGFEKKGWVARVEGSRKPGLIAADLPRAARQMPDEQARIYETRLGSARHVWRTLGDLFVITGDGVEELRRPTVEEKAFNTAELQELIVLQSQAVAHDFDPDPDSGHVLGVSDVEWWNPHSGMAVRLPRLLPEEYEAWLGAVLPDHKARWGEGAHRDLLKRIPIQGGAGKTDVYENRVQNQENQKTQMPALVAPWFMCLVILALTDTDTPTTARDGTHIPTYTGYGEASVAAADMATASAGSAANANAITFAACTSGSSNIVGFGNKETNGTTGDLRKYGTCATTAVSTTQTPATFSTGAYTTTED
jgi:hypothetical protein